MKQPKTLLKTIIFIFLFHASFAFGAIQEKGTVDPGWLVYSDGYVFFYLSGTKDGPTTCTTQGSGTAERWAFDTTTPVGKSQFSAFLSAVLSAKRLEVVSNGTCVHDNTDNVNHFSVID